MARLGWITASIAIVGLVISGISAERVYRQEASVDRIALSRAIDVQASLVQERMSERELLARVSSGLFRTPQTVAPNMLEPLRKSIYAFRTDFVTASFIARVAPENIAQAKNAISEAGLGDRPIRFSDDTPRQITGLSEPIDVMIDVEPRTLESCSFVGRTYDDRSTLGATLDEAARENKPVTSDPTPLLRRSGALGTILVTPVVADNGTTTGFITFSYEIAPLMLAEADPQMFATAVRDPRNPNQEFVTSPTGELVKRSIPAEGPAPQVRIVSFGGHDWSLAYYPTADMHTRSFRTAIIVGTIGLALTMIVCLLFGYTALINRRLSREIDVRIGYEQRLTTVIDELNHRVKNILAVIQSIVTRTLRGGADLEVGRDLLIGRIHAMSNVVSLLSESQWRGVPIRGLFEGRTLPHAERITVVGPDIMVSARAAQSLSLLFYELASHTDEGLSLVGKHPDVVAQWEITGSGETEMFRFRWEELNTSEQTRRPESDFGAALLDRVAPEALGGHAKRYFSDAGYTYELEAPMKTVVDLTERERTDQIAAPINDGYRKSLIRPTR